MPTNMFIHVTIIQTELKWTRASEDKKTQSTHIQPNLWLQKWDKDIKHEKFKTCYHDKKNYNSKDLTSFVTVSEQISTLFRFLHRQEMHQMSPSYYMLMFIHATVIQCLNLQVKTPVFLIFTAALWPETWQTVRDGDPRTSASTLTAVEL